MKYYRENHFENRKPSLTPLLLLLFLSWSPRVFADDVEAHHVILVTIDGLRGEEVFTGADQRLIDQEAGGVENVDAVREQFWHRDPHVRRERLMPFFWNVVVKHGQVFGSHEDDCYVTVMNGRYFSYPGYQELLCGYPDDRVDSNDKKYNENVTVLEWLHRKSDFNGRIATFASWDVFPYILNDKRSGIYVNAGWQDFTEVVDPNIKDLLNHGLREVPRVLGGVRLDFFTASGAMEYVKRHKPRIVYVALGETDDWAHRGRYDHYLEAAHFSDQILRRLWELVQQTPEYQGRTSLVITSDHGRGDGRDGWKNHSVDLPGSQNTWIAVLGPRTPALGVRSKVKVTQGQAAATVASLVGHDYTTASDQVADPLPRVVRVDEAADSSTRRSQ